MKPNIILAITASLFLAKSVKSQQEINVNPAKGMMTVNIPIHKFDMLDFKVEVGFSYAAKGYQVARAPAGNVGWQFYGGGTITRILRDLPDEKAAVGGDSRLGWLEAGLYASPPSFSLYDDNDENDCTDEANNNTIINAYGNTVHDLQPDIFNVEAPGLNCRLMIDNQGIMREVSSAQDLKIEFLTNSNSDRYFVITNKNGIKYTFNQYSKTTRKRLNDLFDVDLFKRAASFYNTALTYPDTWYLTSIATTNNNPYASLTYDYAIEPDGIGSESRTVYVKSNSADTARAVGTSNIQLTLSGKRYLKSIYNSLGTKIEFPGVSDFPSEISIYNSTAYQAPVDRKISFWTRLAYDNTNGGGKAFITIMYDLSNGCQKQLYKFEYYGLLNEGSGTADFPVTKVHQTDAWGFPNGSTGTSQVKQMYVYPEFKSTTGVYRPYAIPGYTGTSYILPGTDATVNPDKVMMGTMSKITYPNGGASTFEYESNSFFDGDANAEVKGAGIRIKAINTFDGLDPSAISRKEYIYLNDLNQTSGIINKLPSCAISTPYYFEPYSNTTKSYATIISSYGANSAAYWNHLTARTAEDLSGGSEVSYSEVTIKEPGNGKVKTVYNTPYSFWDLSRTIPTYAAEPCNSNNSTFITKSHYQYPFANVEHRDNQNEKLSESFYNESGNLLKKNEFSYEEYSPTPIKIVGFLFDSNFGIRQFSRYHTEIYKRLLVQSKETNYDSNLTGNNITVQTDYDNSAYNRNVRAATVTNSDQSKTKTTYGYNGDFSGFTLSEISNSQEALGLYWLNDRNVKNQVLEEITSIALPGSSQFKIINSKLNLFKKNPFNTYVSQSEERVLRNINGLTDFVALSMAGTGTNRMLAWDNRYEPYKQFLDYSANNIPAVITENRLSTTLVNDYILKVPLLKVMGAEMANIVFSNFDRLDANTAFTIENSSNLNYITDSYAGFSYALPANNGLNKSFIRNTNDKFYKFVFLAKTNTATQVNIQVNGTTVVSIPVDASLNYKFYEREIDLSNVTNGTVRFVATGDLVVDNVLFYPADAQFTATNYIYNVGKVMEINQSGLIRLYDYDLKGRMTAIKDGERNIIEAKLYHEASSTTSGMLYNTTSLRTDINVINPDDQVVGYTVKFSATVECVPGVKYIWNFGDGNTLTSYNREVTHVYNTPSNYNVTVIVQHPEFTSYTATKSIVVESAPFTVSLCASGIIARNTCTNYVVYADCPGKPPGIIDAPDGTIFYTTVTGCSGTSYYNWEFSTNGYTYNSYSSGSNDMLYIPEYFFYSDFYMRCRAVTSCGKEATTEPVLVQNNCNVY